MNINVIMEVVFYVLSIVNMITANILYDNTFLLAGIGIFIVARTYTIQRKLEEENEKKRRI